MQNEFLYYNNNIGYPMDTFEKGNENNFSNNKEYNIKGLVEEDPKYRKKINSHMRKVLL